MFLLQKKVGVWLDKTFTPELADNPRQRMQRFLEEALEWFQAEDMTKDDALALVDYVFSRPKGDPEQEVGGVHITVLAACHKLGYDYEACGYTEFNRINTPHMIEKIRQKQDAKNEVLGISDT